MINKCPCCTVPPVDAGMISCQNNKCTNYNDLYFIWEWQKLDKSVIELDQAIDNPILDV